MKERWTNEIQCENWGDLDGNPGGGNAKGNGIDIKFQDGPTKTVGVNGAFVEDLILVAIQRLNFFQEYGNGKYRCRENSIAITKLEESLMWLQRRKDNRESRGVHGTNKQ